MNCINPLNPTQLYVTTCYFYVSVLCIIILGLSYLREKNLFLVLPLAVILNIRSIIRLLDFEQTRFDPDDSKNPERFTY